MSCLLALIWWQFRVDRGWFGVSVGLAEIIMRAGLGFVWGSFSLGKGPICRMLLGGFQVDFGSVLAWLGLIRARCAAGLAVAFGLLQGCGSASFGLGLVAPSQPRSTTKSKPIGSSRPSEASKAGYPHTQP